MSITEDQYRQWNEDGFVVIDHFLTAEELDAARAGAGKYFPTEEEYFAAPRRYDNLTAVRWFPFADPAVNDACMHPDLVEFAERALGTSELMLTHGHLWAKYAGQDYDQELHSDFGNNSLVYPREEGQFRHLVAIIYLTDITEEHGPTYIVPRRFADHVSLRTGRFGRDEYPELYEHEVPVIAKAGSILIYGMGILHRGSAIRGERVGRLTVMTGLRKAGYEWMGHHHNFAWHGNDPHLRAWLEHATSRERQLLGFPAPGHPYWNEQTLEGTARRYPKMDLTPYRDALASTRGQQQRQTTARSG